MSDTVQPGETIQLDDTGFEPVDSDHDVDFTLPNVGPGPDLVSPDSPAADGEAVVLFLHRDYHCNIRRRQVQQIADRIESFKREATMPMSVLPEPVDRARSWQEQYELPYPLLADPNKEVGAQYDQQTRFGVVGRLHDLFGRMPSVVVLDTRTDEPRLDRVYHGDSPRDRPSMDEVLATVHRERNSFVFDCELVDC